MAFQLIPAGGTSSSGGGITKAIGDGYWLDLNAANGPLTASLTVSGNVNMTDGYHADGSAASPSMTFTSDPDRGMYHAAANQIGFAVGGTAIASISGSQMITPNAILLGGGVGINNIGSGQVQISGTTNISNSGAIFSGSTNSTLSLAPTGAQTTVVSVAPGANATNAFDVAPTAGTTTIAYNARNNSITRYASWGSAGNEIYGFYGSGNVGAALNASLSMSQPISGVSQASSSGIAVFKYDNTKRVTPQIGYDGYGFADLFNGYTGFKNVTQSVTGTSLVDDSDFQFTLDGSARYSVMLDGYGVNVTNGNALNFDFAGTAGVANMMIIVELVTTDFSANNLTVKTSLGGGRAGPASVTGTGITQRIHAAGSIQTTNGGTFKLQIASSSSGTVQLFRGAAMTVRRI